MFLCPHHRPMVVHQIPACRFFVPHAQRHAGISDNSIPAEWPSVTAACAAATFSAALQRVALPAVAITLLDDLSLDMETMGSLQAAVLGGYVVGQVPSGALADRVGGLRVLTTGLALWSVATTAIALTASCGAAALPALVALRGLVGLAQSCMMPAVAAAVSHAVPSHARAGSTGLVYACFSLGTVVGLGASPLLAHRLGWQGVFAAYGALGLAAAACSWWVVRRLRPLGKDATRAPGEPASRGLMQWAATPSVAPSLAAFLWVHGVIGYGFFMLQAWTPLYLNQLAARPGALVTGYLSAVAWLGSAVAGVGAGAMSDWLQRQGWRPQTLRTTMHCIASLGPAVALLPLVALGPAAPLPVAVACLCAALTCQGFNYAGFHSYVQDVVSRRAGQVLGLTNTSSTLAGFAGTVVTGVLASRGGFAGAFGVTSALYVSSALVWLLMLRGQRLD